MIVRLEIDDRRFYEIFSQWGRLHHPFQLGSLPWIRTRDLSILQRPEKIEH